MTTAVLCAVRGPTETQVVRVLGAVEGLTVSRRCADLAELLAAGAAGLGQVAVLSADVPGLDREAVRHLHASGVWVVALTDVRNGWSVERVRALGVDAVVDETDLEAAVGSAVGELVTAGARGARPGPAARALHEAGPEGSREPARHDGPLDVRLASGPGTPNGAGDGLARGRVVAVWGATGAPGRTTVALNLAAELAPHGALLVDADTYGGTVAQMLGLLDEAPGIAAAARAASTGRIDVRALAALTPVLSGGLRVLTGLSRADRWPEVPASSLEPIWAVARELAAWTVVDCGFCVEQDEALSYDTRAPRRNAATLSALAEADVVVVVGGGDPIALQRLVRGLADLSDIGVPAGVRRVVVNRVRASASGPRPGDAITEALRRYAGVGDVHLVPEDRAACDGAVLAARTLPEHAPTSPARRAIAALAGSLAGSLAGPVAGSLAAPAAAAGAAVGMHQVEAH